MLSIGGDKPLMDEWEFVSVHDPCLDWGEPGSKHAQECAEGYRLYLDTGSETHLKRKPGQDPTHFKLRSLSAKQYALLDALVRPLATASPFVRQHSSGPVFYEFCRACLTGWEVKNDRGGDVQFTTEFDSDQKADVASERVMLILRKIGDALPGKPDFAQDIGLAAWRRTYLSPLS